MFYLSKFRLVTLFILTTLIVSLVPSMMFAEAPSKLILATTTSTADSGLLDNILPDFEQQYNATVEVIAVGTGQALKLGEDGNVDVILVHARAREDKFVDDGHGVNREDVMYNDFIILGPESDPAGVKGMTDAAEAFKMIADAEAPFVSRGDDSGTHTKEKTIWAAAGIEPEGDWYISAGQGMGAVLTMANEQQAYTLTDRGTYLARTLEGIDLGIAVGGDLILFNPYGVIAINPEKYDTVNYDLAMNFIGWITSSTTQGLIGGFIHPSGQPLFVPNSDAWNAIQGGDALSGTITIFHAGSLTVPVKEMVDTFTAVHPDVTFETEASGSVECARKVSELDRPADVVMSADYTVIDRLLIPDWADWNVLFAKNDMVIAYTDQSKFADEITADNWYEVLTRDGVIYGHAEPTVDPCGYRTLMVWQLAEKHYDEAGLYDKLEQSCPPEHVRPKSVELIILLQSGDMDYAFEYRSVAVQHGLNFLELPAEINLSKAELADYYAQASVELPGKEPGETMTITGKAIVYGVTVPKTAEQPDLGIAFTKFLIGPEGQGILDAACQPPIVPAVAADVTLVPDELQSLIEAK